MFMPDIGVYYVGFAALHLGLYPFYAGEASDFKGW
jgi:hypothetical protein